MRSEQPCVIGERVAVRQGPGDDGAKFRRIMHALADRAQDRRPYRTGSRSGPPAVCLADPARMRDPVPAHRIREVVGLLAEP